MSGTLQTAKAGEVIHGPIQIHTAHDGLVTYETLTREEAKARKRSWFGVSEAAKKRQINRRRKERQAQEEPPP